MSDPKWLVEEETKRWVDAEILARRFHETYERLAPHFGYETRKASAVPWEDVPKQNKDLMVAVAYDILTWTGLQAPQRGEGDDTV